jgi:hypothetical protein
MVQIDHLRHRSERRKRKQVDTSAESRLRGLRGFSRGLEEVHCEPAAVLHCGQAATCYTQSHCVNVLS